MRAVFITMLGLAAVVALLVYVKPVREKADRVIFNDATTLRDGTRMETPIGDAAAVARQKISAAVGSTAATISEP